MKSAYLANTHTHTHTHTIVKTAARKLIEENITEACTLMYRHQVEGENHNMGLQAVNRTFENVAKVKCLGKTVNIQTAFRKDFEVGSVREISEHRLRLVENRVLQGDFGP
jgi:hypothetical protein